MKRAVGIVGVVFALCACDAPPDIHVRIFNGTLDDSEYRVSQVVAGRRIAPAFTARPDPSRPRTAESVVTPEVELRVTPNGPLPTFEYVCFDVQQRSRVTGARDAVRVCTRFEKDRHLRQDVYFNWLVGYGSGGTGRCALPAPDCRWIGAAERRAIEARAVAPEHGAPLSNDSWGDNDLRDAESCTYVCPERERTELRPAPTRDAGADAQRDAANESGAVQTGDAMDADASEPDARAWCIDDAGPDGADGRACEMPP